MSYQQQMTVLGRLNRILLSSIVAAWGAPVAAAAAVKAIRVTTAAGNTFDGDEESQGRMARAILGLESVPNATVTWVLADNSEIQASAAELREALALAGAEQARLWVKA